MLLLICAILSFTVMCFLFDYANKKDTKHKELFRNLGHLCFCLTIGLFVVLIFKTFL